MSTGVLHAPKAFRDGKHTSDSSSDALAPSSKARSPYSVLIYQLNTSEEHLSCNFMPGWCELEGYPQ